MSGFSNVVRQEGCARRTEVLQEIPQMNFAEILQRAQSDELSQSQAASLPGMSERAFRRCRDRYEAKGAEGLYYRAPGKVSQRRIQVDRVTEGLELFDIEGVMWCYATNGSASVSMSLRSDTGLSERTRPARSAIHGECDVLIERTGDLQVGNMRRTV